MIRVKTLVTVLVALLISATGARAEVPAYYQQVARHNNIPPVVLYAVAIQESRPPSGVVPSVSKPWPWTLNCDGKGIYLSTKREAYQYALISIATGQSCDIGLMQINWYWHQTRFTSLLDALDPYTNIQVAANILNEHYATKNDWYYAVGAYHSPSNAARANRYRKLVKRHVVGILEGKG